MSSLHNTAVALLLTVFVLAVPSSSMAEDRLGGHFGVLFPLVNHVDGATTTIGDQFKIGFPMGITVKTADTWAFDLELVPVVTSDRFVSLTVHPGIIHSLPHSLGAGVRMAFDARESSWGFTPLLNRSFPAGPVSYFVEGVVPIRFQEKGNGKGQTAIGLGVHFGVGF
jgi:hypothetical protein